MRTLPGESEAILRDVLAGYGSDWPVISTKVYYDTNPENPNASGLSRKAIEQELRNSLERLGVEAIDLYQIHRWDEETPIAETLRALDDAVRRGHVRYIGASSMWTYQFAAALGTSDRLGLERFIAMQNQYSLVYREEEREMMRLCRRERIGTLSWSPLARGYLARPHEEFVSTERSALERDTRTEELDLLTGGASPVINSRVEELAEEKAVSMAQIALSWHLHKTPIAAPIVGVTWIDHLEEAVGAIDIDLSQNEIAYLEEPYKPKPVNGHE